MIKKCPKCGKLIFSDREEEHLYKFFGKEECKFPIVSDYCEECDRKIMNRINSIITIEDLDRFRQSFKSYFNYIAAVTKGKKVYTNFQLEDFRYYWQVVEMLLLYNINVEPFLPIRPSQTLVQMIQMVTDGRSINHYSKKWLFVDGWKRYKIFKGKGN